MQAFLQHVGHNNLRHIEDTVTNRRSIAEILFQMPSSAPERDFFENGVELSQAATEGTFNCWALPSRAKARFEEINVGDLFLIVPWIGMHNGGVHHLGIVKAKCPVPSHQASRILWPHSEEPNKLYPYLFFFDTETGYRDWFEFLDDLGYDHNYNPRGYFLRLNQSRFANWGGIEGYLEFLRSEGKFRPFFNTTAMFETRSAYDIDELSEPKRSSTKVTRIVRDNALTVRLKLLHEYQCQVCGYYIELPGGDRYAEAHHIQPLGRNHKGPDIRKTSWFYVQIIMRSVI